MLCEFQSVTNAPISVVRVPLKDTNSEYHAVHKAWQSLEFIVKEG